MSFLVGCTSLLVSWHVGHRLEQLPPAYHDEYSYVFQARTLLDGRLSYPSASEFPSIFDQLHVVNQGRFASRYYPGTGAWLAPWVSLGHPIWGQWLAGALVAMLSYWIARELVGEGVAFLAGMLVAVSPGLALFSNLLLAHHPTLLGLAVFLHGFVLWMTRRTSLRLMEAGVGLAFGMLCRPATAAGFALPFGVWFCSWMLRDQTTQLRVRYYAAFLLGLPLLVGWTVMGIYNHSITGDWFRSPYQLYTDIYTPRHVYGFNNVVRGESALNGRKLPLVTRNYDAWAENLTPSLAVQNVWKRLLASLRWSWGLLPLAGLVLAGWRLPLGRERDSVRESAWMLMAWGIVSLHAIHIPYWFDGIMHWHYVFESGVLWLLLAARSIAALVTWFQYLQRPWLIVWLGCVLLVSVGTNYVSFDPYWETRLEIGLSEIRFARRKYAEFQSRIAREVADTPALVLVIPDESDRHMDLITNEPSLTAPILFGRLVETETPLESIARAFPDRRIYVYDAKTKILQKRVHPF